MVSTYDVGSMPLTGSLEAFTQGLKAFQAGETLTEPARYFADKIVEGFADKVKAGIDVPNYPQLRDMNQMFLEMFEGLMKVEGAYVAERLQLKPGMGMLPEVQVLKAEAERILEKLENPPERLKVKVCVTGPYTLASLFLEKDAKLFRDLGEVLAEVASKNFFREGKIEVSMLSLDEPVFGTVDDSLLDYGSPGREELLKAWDRIFWEAKTRKVETVLHLHDTRNELFWDLENLQIVESHVGDSIYSSTKVKRLVEERDKFLKASIALTDFDSLIAEKLKSQGEAESIEQKIGAVWSDIKKGKTRPDFFLESVEAMRARVKAAIEFFGEERIPYSGPECGLSSFPTYACALECLRRTVEASKLS
ncbi:MAG: hypothetical protein DRO43_00595 [Candidatus Hecatellales archaeon]|nr:MAG: hypothetical protein DRO43_00595 [Candidatus Hecatellales archaeon]